MKLGDCLRVNLKEQVLDSEYHELTINKKYNCNYYNNAKNLTTVA